MDEEKFTRMEEARQDALEMAKEENATPKATAEDEEGLRIVWGCGVTRHPRGLQLIGRDCQRVG